MRSRTAGVDPGPVVPHLDHHVRADGEATPRRLVLVEHRVARVDDDDARRSRGLAGVDHQVHQDLIDLRSIRQDVPGRVEIRAELEPRIDREAKELHHLGRDLVDRERHRHLGAALREAQERPGELGARLRGRLDLGERLEAGRIVLALAERAGDQADRGEEVVEVVRDAAGELTDRLDPLGAEGARLGLGPRDLGLDLAADVDERDDDVGDLARVVEHRARLGADVHPPAVAAMDHDVVDDDGRARLEGADERHLVFGIERAVAAVDAVGRGVLADGDVVARAHAHDLDERLVRVDELTAGRARHPDADRKIVRYRRGDLRVRRRLATHPTRMIADVAPTAKSTRRDRDRKRSPGARGQVRVLSSS